MNKKDYIGNGRQVKEMDIVNVTISMEEAQPFIHEYEGKKYLSFQVAKLKSPNQYGQTHSAYIYTSDETAPAESTKPKTKRRRSAKAKS